MIGFSESRIINPPSEGNGNLYVAGDNSNGVLGLGHTNPVLIPTMVPGFSDVKKALVYREMLIINNNGDLYGCGHNLYGGLGLGNQIIYNTPQYIMSGVADIGTGLYSNYILKTDGTLLGMGRNIYGELGQGDTSMRLSPVVIDTGVTQFKLQCSSNSLVYLKGTTAYSCGSNAYGQLGRNRPSTADQHIPMPCMVGNCSMVSQGNANAIFLLTNGEVWGTGRGDQGMLGGATTSRYNYIPINLGVTAVSIGSDYYSSLLMDSTSVKVTGRSDVGQLGTGVSPIMTWMDTGIGDIVEITGGYFGTGLIRNDLSSIYWTGSGLKGEQLNGIAANVYSYTLNQAKWYHNGYNHALKVI
jgi:alpha-tubulin suppressor-like RCC1 family protein